jgi:hypothetical protein
MRTVNNNLIRYIDKLLQGPRKVIRTTFLDVEIDRPVSIVGLQGGGLTLISRILRRSQNTASVRGNSQTWYTNDEMQNELSLILPVDVTVVHVWASNEKTRWQRRVYLPRL